MGKEQFTVAFVITLMSKGSIVVISSISDMSNLCLFLFLIGLAKSLLILLFFLSSFRFLLFYFSVFHFIGVCSDFYYFFLSAYCVFIFFFFLVL